MNNDQFNAAIEALHADDSLADRALARARSGKHPRRRRGAAKPITAVVALAVAVLLATGGAAYAVVNSDFFALAWGDHGGGQVQSYSTTWDDGSVHTYTMEYGDGTASSELEDYVEHVGITLEANGYTLAVEDMTMDANAAGAVTMTLSNPDGIDYYEPAAATGELSFDAYAGGPCSIAMLFGDDFADERCYIDRDATTDTELHFTMYFASPNGASDLERDITWQLDWSCGSGHGSNDSSGAQTEPFRSTKQIGVKRFSLDNGTFAEISPFSVRTQVVQEESTSLVHAADAVKRIALELADGSEQVIYESMGSTVGSYFGLIRDDGSAIHVPTKLIDPAEVSGVEMEAKRIYQEDGHEVLGDLFTITLE